MMNTQTYTTEVLYMHTHDKSARAYLCGSVKNTEGLPVKNAEVELEHTGIIATTNQYGRYIISTPLTGYVTLKITCKDMRGVEKEIFIPGHDTDIEIVITEIIMQS